MSNGRLDLIHNNFDKFVNAFDNIKIGEEEKKEFEKVIKSSERRRDKSRLRHSRSKSRGPKIRSGRKFKSLSRVEASLESSLSIDTSKCDYSDSNKKSIKNWTREWIWYNLEESDDALHSYPRPIYGKTPHFHDTKSAAINLTQLEEFRWAKIIKVGSSMALMPLRGMVLKSKELLYSNVKDLQQEDSFYCIKSKDLKTAKDIGIASTKKGLISYGNPVKIGLKSNIQKIDMFVVGSVAVSTNGVRLGTGKGIEDIDWGMMYDVGAVNQDTIIVTLVAEDQIVDERYLPEWVRFEHDIPVDIICTPNRVIKVERQNLKPARGIMSHILTPDIIERSPAIKLFIE